MVDLGMEKAAFKALSSLALDGSLVWRFSVSRICGVWRRPRFVEQELFMLQLSYVDLFGRHQFSVPLTADEVICSHSFADQVMARRFPGAHSVPQVILG
jgi:hypothetical protein